MISMESGYSIEEEPFLGVPKLLLAPCAIKNSGIILTLEGSISEISSNQSNLLDGFTMAWIKKK